MSALRYGLPLVAAGAAGLVVALAEWDGIRRRLAARRRARRRRGWMA